MSKRFIFLLVITITLLGLLLFAFLFPRSNQEEESEAVSFIFATVGDISDSPEAYKVLNKLSRTNTEFTITLGDLGYVGNGNEKIWCDSVKDILGANYPFLALAGNHDDGTKDGDITEYVKCLPPNFDGVFGEYGIEYYFDYKNVARFIQISPNINNYGFDYSEGSEHLNWVIGAINRARDSGIQWVVLGMHKNCINPGTKSCEIGEDLFNAAIENGVDLILQGHEHAYFRSSQLSLGGDCEKILKDTFSASCVSNTDGEFIKGKGTVLVISGAGGRSLRDLNYEDEEIGYFESFNAKNTANEYGFSLFEVSEDSIHGSFVSATGDFADTFVIE